MAIVKQVRTLNRFMKSDRLYISLWILLDYDLFLCEFSSDNSAFAVHYCQTLKNPTAQGVMLNIFIFRKVKSTG